MTPTSNLHFVQKKSARITARVTTLVEQTLKSAASLSGSSLNHFIIEAALEKAKKLEDEIRILRLNKEDSNFFFELLDNPPKANEKLCALFKDEENLI